MAIQDIDEAKRIVSNYIESDDFTVETLLEESKGNNYRPWYVAALEIMNRYENLTKADIATFQYDKSALRGLLDTQSFLDSGDTGIVEPWTTDELINKLHSLISVSVNLH